jgi:hypothetical protein
VGLVNDHELPADLLEDALLPDDHLVRRDAHVPRTGHVQRLADYSVLRK